MQSHYNYIASVGIPIPTEAIQILPEVHPNSMHFFKDTLVPLPKQALKKQLFHGINRPPSRINIETELGRGVTPLEVVLRVSGS